ncbi:MAG TPA: hypothetical protein VF615_17575 [Longimicrobiaceae bacterium]|jgi:hypothetical protein
MKKRGSLFTAALLALALGACGNDGGEVGGEMAVDTSNTNVPAGSNMESTAPDTLSGQQQPAP